MNEPSSTEIESPMAPDGHGISRSAWYAAYTSARHEKRVAEHLRQREIDCFLPLYETVHRWNNGRHRVQLPLFPGYIFVHIVLRDKLRVLQVPGLLNLVSFSGSPAPLPEKDIDVLRNALMAGLSTQPYRYLNIGSRIEICRGPLRGLRGILLRHQGHFRVVISVEMIMRSIIVEVEAADVVAVHGSDPRLTPSRDPVRISAVCV